MGAHDVGMAPGEGSEGGHSEGDSAAIVELEEDVLMVYDVIITGIDAAAIGAGAEGGVDGFGGTLDGEDGGGPLGGGDGFVEAEGGVGAALLDVAGADVATVGGAGRLMFTTEVPERAEAGHTATATLDDKVDEIEIVAAFRQEHESGLIGTAPITADEGMCHVPPADGFEVADVDDFADGTVVKEGAQEAGVGGIPENMADAEDNAGAAHCGDNRAAFVFRRGHGFFEENVVTTFDGGEGRADVILVLSADEHGVGAAGNTKCLTPVAEHAVGGDAMDLRGALAKRRYWLCYGNNAAFLRMRRHVGTVTIQTTLAGADEEKCGNRGGFHVVIRKVSPRQLQIGVRCRKYGRRRA